MCVCVLCSRASPNGEHSNTAQHSSMTRTVRVLEFVVSEFKVCVCVYSKKSVATPATRKGERETYLLYLLMASVIVVNVLRLHGQAAQAESVATATSTDIRRRHKRSRICSNCSSTVLYYHRLTSTNYRALLKKAEVGDALLMVVVVLALRQILQ